MFDMNIVSINGAVLPVIEINNERVVTLSMIDEAHGRASGTARRSFNEHRERFTKGKHFQKMSADEFRTRFPGVISDRATEDITLVTERGYLLLVKSFTDDLAWQVQDMLVESYFTKQHDTSLTADTRAVIGGIVKGIVHKELVQIIPALVAEQLTSDRFKVIHGVSALQIAEMAGYPKGKRPRGMTQFITQRVRRYHEDRRYLPDRSPYGSGKVLVYNEALSRRWLSEGGQVEVDHYVAGRKGQQSLRLVTAMIAAGGEG